MRRGQAGKLGCKRGTPAQPGRRARERGVQCAGRAMTVAPMMPMLQYSRAGSLNMMRLGSSPRNRGIGSGFALASSKMKQQPMRKMKEPISASRNRKWRPCSIRTNSTSADVMNTPATSGRSNSRFSAMAEPITSAMSQAAMAVSASTQRPFTTQGRYCSRHACARSLPIAAPRRTEKACRMMARMEDSSTMKRRS